MTCKDHASRCTQTKTARRNSMRRAVLVWSREFRGPVELFIASVAEWDAHVSHLVLAA